MAAGSGAVCANRSTSGVHTTVGAIALTRMLRAAYSIAALRVRPMMPALANVYGEMFCCPVRPAVEEADLLPVVDGQLVQRQLGAGDARVVEHHVDAAVVIHRALDRPLDGRGVGGVDGDGQGVRQP